VLLRVPRGPLALALLLAAPLLTACGEKPATETGATRTDSAGVTFVSNTGTDRPLPWRLEVALRIGSPTDPDQEFYGLDDYSVGFGPNGQIYVLDKGNYRIRTYDESGRLLRTIGRKGGGPGEFLYPIAMHILPDGGIRVLDFAKQSWTRFAPDGEPLPGVPLEDLMAMGHELTWTDAGFVTSSQQGYRTKADSLFDMVLLIRGRDTVELGRMGRPRTKMVRYAARRMWIAFPPVFAPELSWAAAGQLIAVSQAVGYRIDVFEGPRLAMRILRDVPTRAMTRADAVASLRGGMKSTDPEGRPCVIDPVHMVDERGFFSPLQEVSLASRSARMAPSGRVEDACTAQKRLRSTCSRPTVSISERSRRK